MPMDMGDMDHGGMDMGAGTCVISMLWNWNTIDACFISSSWHVKSKGGFAGSCIGVSCLVVLLEGLKYLQRVYDRRIILSARQKAVNDRKTRLREDREDEAEFVAGAEAMKQKQGGSVQEQGPSSSSSSCNPAPPALSSPSTNTSALLSSFVQSPARRTGRVRLTVLQQSIRALIHTCQFSVAYFIMLLAMYFNGYIIICIFIGAYIGSFIFSWDGLEMGREGDAQEVTGCCG